LAIDHDLQATPPGATAAARLASRLQAKVIAGGAGASTAHFLTPSKTCFRQMILALIVLRV
jgi:hypothetical protein